MASKPTFEHRHFKAIAAILSDAKSAATERQFVALGGLDRGTVNAMVSIFADKLSATNPNFNRQRFLSACNGTPCNGRDKVRS